MKTFIKRTTAVGTLLVALPVLAQSGLGVQGNVGAQVGSENTQTQTRAQVELQTTADQDQDRDRLQTQDMDSDGDGIQTRAQVQVQTRTNQEAGNAPAESQAQNRATVRINGTEVSVEANNQRAINQAAEVGTDEELGIYARSMTQANARIQAIEANENEVSVTMREDARLFGLFKVGVNRTARVMFDESGEAQVEVSRPWWASFATGASAQTSSEIQSTIANSVQSEVSGTVRAQNKARILENIQAAFGVEASANAEVN